jgi:hypothetical protein
LAELGAIGGERQMHGEAHDPVARDDDRSIVAGRVGVEEREQEGLGDVRMEGQATLHVSVHGLSAGQYDQGAVMVIGEVRDGANERIDGVGACREETAPNAEGGDLLE